jgi:hypothetical protein
MKKGPFILFRVLGALLVLGLIVGAGAFGYKAGVARGIMQAPAIAKAIEKAAEDGQSAPMPQMYGREFGYGYYPMPFHHPGFNPIGAICGSIFFLFLFLGFMKMIFFRGMMHRGWEGHKHGHWGKHWENGTPPMFEEWHKRAHEEKKEDESKNEGKE